MSLESYPTVRDGTLQLQGLAYDPDSFDAVSYRVALYKSDDSATEVANLTTGSLDTDGYHMGAAVNGDLGLLNFTGVANGVYDLVLIVRGGGDEAQDVARIAVESELKLGPLKFSEQDLVIPVNGIPLTIVRTYDSLNPNSGDFGYGWTMAINDVDAALHEDRMDTPAEMNLGSSDADVSVREAWSRFRHA